MCGRYTLDQVEALRARFMAENGLEGFRATYNAASGQSLPGVTRNSPNCVELMRWGLVPAWADDPKVGYRMINAGAETVAEKPAFRSSFRSKRCLVPVTGYYEWKKEGTKKQPYYYRLREQEAFALAGLSAEWHDAQGNELRSFAVITTAAIELAAEVHDRMPVHHRPTAGRASAGRAGLTEQLPRGPGAKQTGSRSSWSFAEAASFSVMQSLRLESARQMLAYPGTQARPMVITASR